MGVKTSTPKTVKREIYLTKFSCVLRNVRERIITMFRCDEKVSLYTMGVNAQTHIYQSMGLNFSLCFNIIVV